MAKVTIFGQWSMEHYIFIIDFNVQFILVYGFNKILHSLKISVEILDNWNRRIHRKQKYLWNANGYLLTRIAQHPVAG